MPALHSNAALRDRRAARCPAKLSAEDAHLDRAVRTEVTAALAVAMGRPLLPRLLLHRGSTPPGGRPEPLLLLRVGRTVPALHSNAALRGRRAARCLAKLFAEDVHLGRVVRTEGTAALAMAMEMRKPIPMEAVPGSRAAELSSKVEQLLPVPDRSTAALRPSYPRQPPAASETSSVVRFRNF